MSSTAGKCTGRTITFVNDSGILKFKGANPNFCNGDVTASGRARIQFVPPTGSDMTLSFQLKSGHPPVGGSNTWPFSDVKESENKHIDATVPFEAKLGYTSNHTTYEYTVQSSCCSAVDPMIVIVRNRLVESLMIGGGVVVVLGYLVYRYLRQRNRAAT